MNNNMTSLCAAYSRYFPIGAAVNPITVKSHKDLLIKHFNSITCENQMKFSELHPGENTYSFDEADMLVSFAVENHMKVRGHTLVWHNQTPDWFFTRADGKFASREELLKRLEAHINNVVGRYKNKVYCWDVVNEAIDDKGSVFLRKSNWLDIIGDDFIEKAFLLAHRADPEALLFYNDYNESDPEKRDKIYSLVKNMKEKDIPIHGMGLQAHWNIFKPSWDEIRTSIEKYAKLDVKLQITELDISVFDFEDHRRDISSPTQEMMDAQAELYRKAFELFREYKDIVSGVTFWGVADDETWLDNFPVSNRKNWPMIFDCSHMPKLSYEKIINFI